MGEKTHINVRVDSDNLARIDEIAEIEKVSRSAAVDKILMFGLQYLDGADHPGGGGGSRELVEAMQNHIDALSAQIAIKDTQIEQYSQLLDQAQQVQARITMALPVAQQGGTQEQETARASQGQGQEHPQGEEQQQPGPEPNQQAASQDAQQQKKRGFWSSLWS